MIEVKIFNFLKKKKLIFFTGVPDSVLKETKHFLKIKKLKIIW